MYRQVRKTRSREDENIRLTHTSKMNWQQKSTRAMLVIMMTEHRIHNGLSRHRDGSCERHSWHIDLSQLGIFNENN